MSIQVVTVHPVMWEGKKMGGIYCFFGENGGEVGGASHPPLDLRGSCVL